MNQNISNLSSRKGMAALEVIVILLLAIIVLFVIMSFVIGTSTPAESEIKLKGEFNQKCVGTTCEQLLLPNDRVDYLCKTLWGYASTQHGDCIRTQCAKCKDAGTGATAQDATTGIQQSNSFIKQGLTG